MSSASRAGHPASHEPKCVAIGIIDIELACSPTLVNRTLMDLPGSAWVSGGAQASFPKLAEEHIDVGDRDGDGLAERAVPSMAGENERVPVPREDVEARIAHVIV